MNGAVYSMTGFAIGKLTNESLGDITLDIRSVNSRFLDLSFKLPDSCRHLEAKLRDAVVSRIRRGKCEVRINIQAGTTRSSTAVDTSKVADLLAKQAQILHLCPTAPVLSVAELLALSTSKLEATSDASPSEAEVLKLMNAALDDFVLARRIEGEKLAAVMLNNIQGLRQQRDAVIPLVPALIEQQRQKFLQKFNEAVSGSEGKLSPSAAEERALTEATAFALRIDVMEEISRLESHLDEIESLLKRQGSQTTGTGSTELGKRLEFLIQELHREANTLGSKSATIAATQIAVEMKVLIEQLREQVQNIE